MITALNRDLWIGRFLKFIGVIRNLFYANRRKGRGITPLLSISPIAVWQLGFDFSIVSLSH